MYEQFYGLTGKPFQLNPDPTFYFGSRQHRRAMALKTFPIWNYTDSQGRSSLDAPEAGTRDVQNCTDMRSSGQQDKFIWLLFPEFPGRRHGACTSSIPVTSHLA